MSIKEQLPEPEGCENNPFFGWIFRIAPGLKNLPFRPLEVERARQLGLAFQEKATQLKNLGAELKFYGDRIALEFPIGNEAEVMILLQRAGFHTDSDETHELTGNRSFAAILGAGLPDLQPGQADEFIKGPLERPSVVLSSMENMPDSIRDLFNLD